MKNKVKWFIMCIIIVCIAFAYAHVDKNYYLYDRNQDSSNYISTGVISGNDTIEQTFAVMADRLSGIKLRGVVLGDVKNTVVSYQLIDTQTGKMITDGEIKGEEFVNSKFYQIGISDIYGTKGKRYALILSETGSNETNGVSFNVAKENQKNENISLIVKGNPVQGSVVLKLYRSGFDIETFVIFLFFIIYIIGFMKVLYKLFK